MCQFAGFILPVGIDDGKGRGQRFPAQMVVEDDDIRTDRRRNRFMREGSAIDTDDQVMCVGQITHRRFIGAVALVDPVGDIDSRLPPEGPQPTDQQGRR